MVKRRIIINSKDRISGTPGEYTIKIPNSFDNNSTCRVISAIIPNSYYTFTQKTNTFAYNDGNDREVFFPTNQYYTTGDELADQLEELLKVNDVDFTVTFSNNTNRITITNNTNVFSINFDKSTCNTFIGIDNVGTSAITSSFIAPNNVDVNPNRSILVHCDIIRGGYTTSFNTKSDILCHIPVDVGTSSFINYFPATKETFLIDSGELINSFNISITDINNKVIDFNGINHELVLEFN